MDNFFVVNKKKAFTLPLLTGLSTAILIFVLLIVVGLPKSDFVDASSYLVYIAPMMALMLLAMGIIFHEIERRTYKKILKQKPFNILPSIGFRFENTHEKTLANFTSQQLVLFLSSYKILFIPPDIQDRKHQVILRAFAKVPDPDNKRSEFNQEAREQGFTPNWDMLDKVYGKKALNLLTPEQIQTDLNNMVKLLQKFHCLPDS